jgi:hypothetical protein
MFLPLDSDFPGFDAAKFTRPIFLMCILWHALFRGQLCRIRKTAAGVLVTETWRNGSWVAGPNFAQVDFTGRTIRESEAQQWIRNYFRKRQTRRK